MHVLDEMTKLSVGQPADSVFMSAMMGSSSKPEEHASAEGAAHRGAEFAAELERMPLLPGAPIMVQTVKELPSPVPPPQQNKGNLPAINVTDMIMPCVFSQ